MPIQASDITYSFLKADLGYGNVIVSVEIDDEPVNTYEVKRTKSITSCYIEAPLGKTFQFHYQYPGMAKETLPMEIQLWIDGELIDTDMQGCDIVHDLVSGCFKGYKNSITARSSTFKAFCSGQPGIQEDLNGDEFGESCSIKVIIGRRKVEKFDHRDPPRKKHKVIPAKTVAIDSKNAAMGVVTVPSPIMIKTPRNFDCRCTFAKLDKTQDHTFIFKYRKEEYLIRQLIKLPSPSDYKRTRFQTMGTFIEQADLVSSRFVPKRNIETIEISDDSDDD